MQMNYHVDELLTNDALSVLKDDMIISGFRDDVFLCEDIRTFIKHEKIDISNYKSLKYREVSMSPLQNSI
jgi:hypothetical protein